MRELLARYARDHDPSDPREIPEDCAVVDRPALVAALTSCVQVAQDTRVAAAGALSRQVGNECAMQ